jgi:hydroxymethylbilane synthase
VFPGASFAAIRGNLDTRLRKLDSGTFDAIVLAAAGLRRLGYGARISAALPPRLCVPAPGQGIIAVEVRSNDVRVKAAVASINDSLSAAMLAAERAVVVRLGGGCQMPIGAHATVSEEQLTLVAVVVSHDGGRTVRSESTGVLQDAEMIGAEAATRLLEQGAGGILAEVESTRGAVEGLQP